MPEAKTKQLSEKKMLAREARNKAQAEEEAIAWKEIRERSSKAMEKAKAGRPVIWTEERKMEAQRELCQRLSEGESVERITLDSHMPAKWTIFEWLKLDSSFANSYVIATENRAHSLLDECIGIADNVEHDRLEDGSPNPVAVSRAKLRIDTRLRMIGKLAPKLYGDRIADLNGLTVVNNSLTIDARELSSEQRDSLRAMLLQASDKAKPIN